MKKVQIFSLIASVVLVLGLVGFVGSAEAARRVRVRGHYRPSTGRYIESHYRTSPNSTRWDNWSTDGNYNPHTGRRGRTNHHRFRFR